MRGKAEFATMDTVDTGNKSSLKPKEDVDINAVSKPIEHDPMRDLLSTKGLVHHMNIPDRFRQNVGQGFVKKAIDEAEASQKK